MERFQFLRLSVHSFLLFILFYTNNYGLVQGQHEESIGAIELAGKKLPLDSFKGDKVLLSKLDHVNSILTFSRTSDDTVVFTSKGHTEEDEIIVIADENALADTGPHKFIVLRKDTSTDTKSAYYVSVAYIRPASKLHPNPVKIGETLMAIEWDAWDDNENSSPTWTTCYSSIFVSCGFNDSIGAVPAESKNDISKKLNKKANDQPQALAPSGYYEIYRDFDNARIEGRGLLGAVVRTGAAVVKEGLHIVCHVLSIIINNKCHPVHRKKKIIKTTTTIITRKKVGKAHDAEPSDDGVPGIFFPDTMECGRVHGIARSLNPEEPESFLSFTLDEKKLTECLFKVGTETPGIFRPDPPAEGHEKPSIKTMHGVMIKGDNDEDPSIIQDDNGDPADFYPDDTNLKSIHGFYLPGDPGNPDKFLAENDKEAPESRTPGTMITIPSKGRPRKNLHGGLIPGPEQEPSFFVPDGNGMHGTFRDDKKGKGTPIGGTFIATKSNRRSATDLFLPDTLASMKGFEESHGSFAPDGASENTKWGTLTPVPKITPAIFKRDPPGAPGTFIPDKNPTRGFHGNLVDETQQFFPDNAKLMDAVLPQGPGEHGKFMPDRTELRPYPKTRKGSMANNGDQTGTFKPDPFNGFAATYYPDDSPTKGSHGWYEPVGQYNPENTFDPDNNPKDFGPIIPPGVSQGNLNPDMPPNAPPMHGTLKQKSGHNPALFIPDAEGTAGEMVPDDKSGPISGILLTAHGGPNQFIPNDPVQANAIQSGTALPSMWKPYQPKLDVDAYSVHRPLHGKLESQGPGKNMLFTPDEGSAGVLTPQSTGTPINGIMMKADENNGYFVPSQGGPVSQGIAAWKPDGSGKGPFPKATRGKVVTKPEGHLFIPMYPDTTFSPKSGNPCDGVMTVKSRVSDTGAIYNFELSDPGRAKDLFTPGGPTTGNASPMPGRNSPLTADTPGLLFATTGFPPALFVPSAIATFGSLTPPGGSPVKGTLIDAHPPIFISANDNEQAKLGQSDWKPDAGASGPFTSPMTGTVTRDPDGTTRFIPLAPNGAFVPDSNNNLKVQGSLQQPEVANQPSKFTPVDPTAKASLIPNNQPSFGTWTPSDGGAAQHGKMTDGNPLNFIPDSLGTSGTLTPKGQHSYKGTLVQGSPPVFIPDVASDAAKIPGGPGMWRPDNKNTQKTPFPNPRKGIITPIPGSNPTFTIEEPNANFSPTSSPSTIYEGTLEKPADGSAQTFTPVDPEDNSKMIPDNKMSPGTMTKLPSQDKTQGWLLPTQDPTTDVFIGFKEGTIGTLTSPRGSSQKGILYPGTNAYTFYPFNPKEVVPDIDGVFQWTPDPSGGKNAGPVPMEMKLKKLIGQLNKLIPLGDEGHFSPDSNPSSEVHGYLQPYEKYPGQYLFIPSDLELAKPLFPNDQPSVGTFVPLQKPGKDTPPSIHGTMLPYGKEDPPFPCIFIPDSQGTRGSLTNGVLDKSARGTLVVGTPNIFLPDNPADSGLLHDGNGAFYPLANPPAGTPFPNPISGVIKMGPPITFTPIVPTGTFTPNGSPLPNAGLLEDPNTKDSTSFIPLDPTKSRTLFTSHKSLDGVYTPYPGKTDSAPILGKLTQGDPLMFSPKPKVVTLAKTCPTKSRDGEPPKTASDISDGPLNGIYYNSVIGNELFVPIMGVGGVFKILNRKEGAPSDFHGFFVPSRDGTALFAADDKQLLQDQFSGAKEFRGTFYVDIFNAARYKGQPLPGAGGTMTMVENNAFLFTPRLSTRFDTYLPSGTDRCFAYTAAGELYAFDPKVLHIDGQDMDMIRVKGTFFKTSAGRDVFFINDKGLPGTFITDSGEKQAGVLTPSDNRMFTSFKSNDVVTFEGQDNIRGKFALDEANFFPGSLSWKGSQLIMQMDTPGQTGSKMKTRAENTGFSIYCRGKSKPNPCKETPDKEAQAATAKGSAIPMSSSQEDASQGAFYRIGQDTGDFFIKKGTAGRFVPLNSVGTSGHAGVLYPSAEQGNSDSDNFVPRTNDLLVADILMGTFTSDEHPAVAIQGHVKMSDNLEYLNFVPQFRAQHGWFKNDVIEKYNSKVLQSGGSGRSFLSAAIEAGFTEVDQADLNTHRGWKTQYDISPNVTLKLDNGKFFGIGNCPNQPVTEDDLQSSKSAEDLLDVYTKILRTDCLTRQKAILNSLVLTGLLEKEGKVLRVPKENSLLRKEKLTVDETQQLSKAFEMYMFTLAYSENKPLLDNAPISHSAQFLVNMGLKALVMYRTDSPVHYFRLTRNLLTSVNTIIIKLLQDHDRLEGCTECALDLSVNHSDMVHLTGFMQFIMHDPAITDTEATEETLRTAFTAFLQANQANMEARVTARE